ncbi:20137_t:CDS:2 [Funneliformis geosporum]|nr:20137_t:CDS:2 [Funneliformis geosporum]
MRAPFFGLRLVLTSPSCNLGTSVSSSEQLSKRPGEVRGQFQRSFDTFMFGSRSVLQDPPVIKSGDHRLKYKSVQDVTDKFYKYLVNDMTGTYQRSMTSARLGVSSTSLRSPFERRHASSIAPVLPTRKAKSTS